MSLPNPDDLEGQKPSGLTLDDLRQLDEIIAFVDEHPGITGEELLERMTDWAKGES